jgi:hypothetical protein
MRCDGAHKKTTYKHKPSRAPHRRRSTVPVGLNQVGVSTRIEKLRLPGALVLLVVGGCGIDEGSGPVSAQHATTVASQASSSRVSTIDDKFLSVESAAPGFAGLYLDRSGRLQVHIKSGASAAEARQAIGTAFPALASKTGAAVIRPAEYSWRQLTTWRDTVFSAGFDRTGVTIIDLDETTTKVFVGVATPADSARITGNSAQSASRSMHIR